MGASQISYTPDKNICFSGSSGGKESACNAGDFGLIPTSGRLPGEEIGYPLQFSCFPGVSGGKESACNMGDLVSIPGLGRSPGGGHDNPLQYFCLGNPMAQEGCQGPFRPSGRNRGLPLRRHRGQGTHLAKRWEPRVMHLNTSSCICSINCEMAAITG